MGRRSDHRSLYRFAIFMIALYGILSIVQIFVYILIGPLYHFIEFFVPWYFLTSLALVTVQLMLIWYYHIKKYKFALIAGIGSVLTTLLFILFFYLSLTERRLQNLVSGAMVMLLIVWLIHSMSLFLSKARHKRWLFWSGISGFSVQFVLIVLLLWSMNLTDETLRTFIEMALPWVAMIGCLALVFYVLNFRNEMNLLDVKVKPNPSKLLMYLTKSLGAISILFVFLILYEGSSIYAWQKGKVERSKKFAELFEDRLYINKQNDTLRYRLLLPKDYDEGKKYPIVVNLHHGGGMGKDNLIQLDAAGPAQLLSTTQNREKYPAFVLVPQCPLNSSFRALPNHQGISSLVFEAMETLEEEYNIDDKRRYVLGTSLGGYGTWHFIGVKPELFAAAMPICGGGDPAMASKMTNVPIWAFHGENDRQVPVKLTREMIKTIRISGGNPKYTEFSGEGHNIWNQVSSTPGILEWLFSQKKD